MSLTLTRTDLIRNANYIAGEWVTGGSALHQRRSHACGSLARSGNGLLPPGYQTLRF